MTKVLAIIPARYASTRFPGKPLALLGGKPVIQWVWNRVSAIPELADAVVATDDERIAEAVRSFGGKVIMTSSTQRSGGAGKLPFCNGGNQSNQEEKPSPYLLVRSIYRCRPICFNTEGAGGAG